VRETVDSLRERLAAPDESFDPDSAHLIGQLAAELAASASEQELSQLAVEIRALERDTEHERPPTVRQSVLAVMSGLVQSVLGDRQSAVGAGIPLDIRDRVLNLLVIAPQNPIGLSNAIGCSPAVTSRALTGLREAGLVEATTSSETDDDPTVVHELTTKGEARQDDLFFGRRIDDDEQSPYDYGQVLVPLTEVVAELNTHAPAIAEVLYPGLSVVLDRVDDPGLRAAAVNELGGRGKGNPDATFPGQPMG